MSDKTADSVARDLLLTKLADEFAARFRAGQRPSLNEYIDRYPELADEIRELFPAMVEIERVRDDQQHPAEPAIAWPAPAIRQLGDFRIIREVGKGGMGFVYEAEQMSLGRHVALKLLPRNMLIDPKAKRRFEREAKAAARLHHTNIVPVFGIGEQDGMPYYVMQFIEGPGLDAVLEELRKLQLDHLRNGAQAESERVSRTARRASNPAAEDTETENPSDTALSAADVAQSLLKGGLDATIGFGIDEERRDETAVRFGADLPDKGPQTEDERLAALPAVPRVAVLPESFSLSGSSVTPAGGRHRSKPKNRGRTYWQSVALIGAQVADALEYAHKQGIHHRDIKPSNLLLDKQGTIWVTDFGLAKAVDDQQNLTHTGDILGTLRYMSPEAFEGKTDARSDVYSLGLTLYEMLAFRPAFGERERNRLIKRVTTEEPERLDRLNPQVPRDFVTVVHKAIERDPQERYATAKELAADLERFIADEPILARRQTQLERSVRWARHNPGIALLSTALGAVLIVATIVSLVVAGRMISLANAKTQKAEDERLARLAAVAAGKREANERAQADLARTAADSSFREARKAEEEGRKLLYTTDMQLAPFVWRDDRSTAEQLRVLLARHVSQGTSGDKRTGTIERPDLRGFEWYYYQHVLEQSANVFAGPGAAVVAGAFAANGQLITLDENGRLRRFDLDSQQEDEANRFDLPFSSIASARSLSPDGRLAALCERNKLHVFDTGIGNETFSIDSADLPYRRPIFSRNADTLVIVDDKIRWLSTKNGEVIASLDRKFNSVRSLALSLDGLTLAVVGHGQTDHQFSIFRLDATAHKVTLLAKDAGFGGTLLASALSPDGRWIAVSAKLGPALFVFDTVTGQTIAEHRSAHASPIAALAFSTDGAKLATADAEGTIKIWAAPEIASSKSRALVTLKGRQRAIVTLGFSSDGQRLVTTSADRMASVWDLTKAGAAIQQLERSGMSLAARFSPDGQLIACAGGDTVRLWDAATGRLVRELSAGDEGPVLAVAFSPTDNRLLAVGYGGPADASHVALWDIDGQAAPARLPGAIDLPSLQGHPESGAVVALAFSPDGKHLVAGFGSKTLYAGGGFRVPLKVWEVANRRLIGRLNGHWNYCVALCFSPDGKLLASGSRDGTAILWSTASWNSVRRLQNPDPDRISGQLGNPAAVEDLAFSQDGKLLALASRGGSVPLWEVATGKLVETLKGHSGGVSAVAFSPDGRTLASGSNDNTVRLWNLGTRRELMQLDPGSVELGYLRTLAFSRDGRHLLAAGERTAAVWSAAPFVWNDSDRAAENLRLLLDTRADFASRVQMFSEHVRLHEALAKLDQKDVRVQAALAATEANWYASRKKWPQAVAAFDRLMAADPSGAAGWLRTPGLLRQAMALLQQHRPAVAATLLQGGAKRRVLDGLGIAKSDAGPGYSDSAHQKQMVQDEATGELLRALRVAVERGLVKEPGSPALLELRAELAGQSANAEAQVADYTAAIETLARQKPGPAAADLARLFGRRANAHLALRQWQHALDDFARVITDATTDEDLLSNRALAMAEVMRPSADVTITDPWQKLAAAYRLNGDQAAIDQLVERHPKLAGPIGDLFTQAKDDEKDWRRAIALYTTGITATTTDADLLSKRAIAHEALNNWDLAATDWSRAATESPNGARMLAEFARRLAGAGKVPLAKSQFEKSRALYERSLAAEPEIVPLASELAQLMFDEHENDNATRWTVLKPIEMRSKGGAPLTLLNDGSILAGGVNPPSDEYTLAFVVAARMEIRALRLEALAHESLPGHGPGRGVSGTVRGLFEMRRWALSVKRPDGADSLCSFSFRAAAADHSMKNTPIGLHGVWNISWEAGRNHTSVWSLSQPIAVEAGSPLRSQMQFNTLAAWSDQNLGRFRVSASGDPAAFDGEERRFAAMHVTDPWSRLAAAYRLLGQKRAFDELLKVHPLAPADMGDLYAAERDWERAIAEYRKLDTEQTASGALLAKLAAAYQAAGRTRESVPYLARMSAAEPEDPDLFQTVAALQAWFGQENDLAATRQRILAFAEGASDIVSAACAAKVCCLPPAPDTMVRDRALALARKAVHFGPGNEWCLLALGMAEFRSGHMAEVDAALVSPGNLDNDDRLQALVSFYRALSLNHQGKTDESRKLAMAAAAKMKPLPTDENNPLASGGDQDDLILWLAYKEAKAMIQFDAGTPPKAPTDAH